MRVKDRFINLAKKHDIKVGQQFVVDLCVELDAVEERLEAAEIAIKALQLNEASKHQEKK